MCSTSIAWRSFPAYNAAFRNTPKLFLKSGHTSAGHRLYKATRRNSPPTDQSVDYSSCRLCKIDFGTLRPIRGSDFQKGVASSAFVYLGSTALPRASPHLSHISFASPPRASSTLSAMLSLNASASPLSCRPGVLAAYARREPIRPGQILF
jgi:hypothetical protein